MGYYNSFKLREVNSHENWYIYIVRKSRDQWLCTQSWSRKGLCTKVWDIRARWLCMVCDREYAWEWGEYAWEWGEYAWEWNWMKPANPRLQRMAIFRLHGMYDNHVHNTHAKTAGRQQHGERHGETGLWHEVGGESEIVNYLLTTQ